jgi:hypothetical protein
VRFPVPMTLSRRSLTLVSLVLILTSVALTSLMVEPLVALFGLRGISSHPAGATNELSGSLRFPVRGKGGRMRFKDRAE